MRNGTSLPYRSGRSWCASRSRSRPGSMPAFRRRRTAMKLQSRSLESTIFMAQTASRKTRMPHSTGSAGPRRRMRQAAASLGPAMRSAREQSRMSGLRLSCFGTVPPSAFRLHSMSWDSAMSTASDWNGTWPGRSSCMRWRRSRRMHRPSAPSETCTLPGTVWSRTGRVPRSFIRAQRSRATCRH